MLNHLEMHASFRATSKNPCNNSVSLLPILWRKSSRKTLRSTWSNQKSWYTSCCSGRQYNQRQAPRVRSCKWTLQTHINTQAHQMRDWQRLCVITWVTFESLKDIQHVPVCRSAAVLSLIMKYACILGRTPVCTTQEVLMLQNWLKNRTITYLLLCIFPCSWPSWHSRERQQLHMHFVPVCHLPQVWVMQGCFEKSRNGDHPSDAETQIHLTWWSHCLLLKLDNIQEPLSITRHESHAKSYFMGISLCNFWLHYTQNNHYITVRPCCCRKQGKTGKERRHEEF